jgi:hypothetical protein
MDFDDHQSDATYFGADIGVSVDSLDKGPGPRAGESVESGSFAIQAQSVVFTDVRQRAWATTAGTFSLSDLSLSVQRGRSECF